MGRDREREREKERKRERKRENERAIEQGNNDDNQLFARPCERISF